MKKGISGAFEGTFDTALEKQDIRIMQKRNSVKVDQFEVSAGALQKLCKIVIFAT